MAVRMRGLASTRTLGASALVVLTVFVGACGGSGNNSSSSDKDEKVTTTVTDAAADAAEAIDAAATTALVSMRESVAAAEDAPSNAAYRTAGTEVRTALYELDAEVRDVDVDDTDLEPVVAEFLVASADAIASLDEVTAGALTAGDVAAYSDAMLAAFSAAIELQFGAWAVSNDDAATGPSLVLVSTDDLGASAANLVIVPVGTASDTGLCGGEKAWVTTPPVVKASSRIQDAESSVSQTAFVFADAAEAEAVVEAAEAEMSSCTTTPEGGKIDAVEPISDAEVDGAVDGGFDVTDTASDGVVSLTRVIQIDNRVFVIECRADGTVSSMPADQLVVSNVNQVTDLIVSKL